MQLVKLGSYYPPTPTKYSLEISDIDSEDTGRGETGYMSRERVRAGIYKLALGFTNITSDDVLAIKEAISGEEITVELFDGSTVSAQMYSGNRKLELKSVDDNSNCFWDMSFNLTEF